MLITDKRLEVLEILFKNSEKRTLTSRQIYQESDLSLNPADTSNTVYDLKKMNLAKQLAKEGKFFSVGITDKGILELEKAGKVVKKPEVFKEEILPIVSEILNNTLPAGKILVVENNEIDMNYKICNCLVSIDATLKQLLKILENKV